MNDSIPALGQFIEPASVPFTPDAPGWYVTAALILLILIVTGILMIYRHYKNRYRREALKQIEQQQLTAGQNYAELLYFINALVKKMTILQHGRKKTAALQNREWLDFLNSQCKKDIFGKEDENLLKRLYLTEDQPEEKETLAFTGKVKEWIKRHQYVTIHHQ